MEPRVESIFNELFHRYAELSACRDEIFDAYRTLVTCYDNNGKLLVCGNGGSASDADHIVGELMKGFLLPRKIDAVYEGKLSMQFDDGTQLAAGLQKGLPAIALSAHSALLTAFCNDVSPDMVFAQQAFVYGRPEDVFMGLSTSGNATNVVNAAKIADSLSLPRIGITGRNGGKLAPLCSCAIRLPEDETRKVQELTLPVYHVLCAMVESHFFG